MAGIDFRELEQFRDTIKQIGEQDAKELCKECSQELAGRLLAKVVKRTPVGVKPNGVDSKVKGQTREKKNTFDRRGCKLGGTLARICRWNTSQRLDSRQKGQ